MSASAIGWERTDTDAGWNSADLRSVDVEGWYWTMFEGGLLELWPNLLDSPLWKKRLKYFY